VRRQHAGVDSTFDFQTQVPHGPAPCVRRLGALPIQRFSVA